MAEGYPCTLAELRERTKSITDCPCGCCVEQVNRELHGRFDHWCMCEDQPVGERCECAHCGFDNDAHEPSPAARPAASNDPS